MFRKLFIDFSVAGYWFNFLTIGIYIMVPAVPEIIPAVFFKKLYKVLSFHFLTSLLYYTPFIRICQAKIGGEHVKYLLMIIGYYYI
mgnify:CR=1 FL=1